MYEVAQNISLDVENMGSNKIPSEYLTSTCGRAVSSGKWTFNISSCWLNQLPKRYVLISPQRVFPGRGSWKFEIERRLKDAGRNVKCVEGKVWMETWIFFQSFARSVSWKSNIFLILWRYFVFYGSYMISIIVYYVLLYAYTQVYKTIFIMSLKNVIIINRSL